MPIPWKTNILSTWVPFIDNNVIVRFVDRAARNRREMEPTWYTNYLQFIESLYLFMFQDWYDMIWYMMYIFNRNWVDCRWWQYITHLHKNNTHNTEKGKFGKCGPCPVFASYTLAFALQLRKKHGKTSVRIASSNVYMWQLVGVVRL
jgi:hypothetical protein